MGQTFAEARGVSLEPGGAAVLVALALARAGVSVGLAAALGADPLGRALRDRVAATGVDVSAVELTLARTGLVFLGASEVVSYRRFEDECVVGPPDASRPRLVHFAALSPEARNARSQVAIAVKFAPRALVTLDLNARPRLWRSVKRRDLTLLGHADLVKCSSDDLDVAGFGRGDAAIDRLVALVPSSAVVLITRGDGPITARGPFGAFERAVRPLRVADASGAGDAFMAGVIGARLADRARSPSLAGVSRWIDRGVESATRWLRARRASKRS
jgi:sugar/nucleoside kinase (ribokinase family)